jgi:hypothetical protein
MTSCATAGINRLACAGTSGNFYHFCNRCFTALTFYANSTYSANALRNTTTTVVVGYHCERTKAHNNTSQKAEQGYRLKCDHVKCLMIKIEKKAN